MNNLRFSTTANRRHKAQAVPECEDRVKVGFADVCTDCKVDGGCDDTSIWCGLVAKHNITADGSVARKRKSSRRYMSQLRDFATRHGCTPYPEQEDLIAKG